MSESTTEQQQAEPQEGEEQPKVFDADYVEKLRKEAAKHRTEAKANKDAADELAALKQAQMTESEKAAAKLAAAEAEVAKVPALVAGALRTHLVALHEIDKDDAELFLTAAEPELLLKQVERLLGKSTDKSKRHVVPREGNTQPKPKGDEVREFAKDFFGRAVAAAD